MANTVHRKHVQRFRLALRYARHQVFVYPPGDLWLNAPDAAPPPVQEQASYYVRRLDRSRYYGYGKKAYKAVYHRRRRREARVLERAALISDEVLFERIAPDAWRGAIHWDIW